MTPVVVPADLWEEDLDGVISTWLFEEGETVQAGALLAEVMVEKVTYEIVAPAAGRLHILCPAEATVSRGMTIAEIV